MPEGDTIFRAAATLHRVLAGKEVELLTARALARHTQLRALGPDLLSRAGKRRPPSRRANGLITCSAQPLR